MRQKLALFDHLVGAAKQRDRNSDSPNEMGMLPHYWCGVLHSKNQPLMSALGQKQTFGHV
jgi:hypothetical protein